MHGKFYLFTLFLAILCGLNSCNANRLQRPVEKYLDDKTEHPSVLQLPIRLSVTTLEQMLNQQLDGVLYEDDTFEDGDRLKIKATKRENILLRLGEQQLRYRVPLALEIVYDLSLGKVKADGSIALQFKTDFAINESWELSTQTIIEEYEWIDKPRVRLAGMRIPIASIGNFLLRRSQDVLGDNIDQAIQDKLDLQAQIHQAWKLLHEPFELSAEYQAWLQIKPDSLQMTPLRVVDDTLNATIAVYGRPEVKFGDKPPTDVVSALPAFRYARPTDGTFTISVGTQLSYREAERLARQQLVGETFQQGRRSVTVDDIKLYGQGEKLIVDLRVRGTYTGSIYLEGYPRYDAQSNSIDIRNLDFSLETKNFLHRSAGWLLKGSIKNKIEDNMNLLLYDNLSQMKRQMQDQIDGLTPVKGVKIIGELEEMNLQNAYLHMEGIRIDLRLSGYLRMELAGLSTPKSE